MAFDLANLPEEVISALTVRHLATLTTLRADGRPHVSPVGFTYDPVTRLARVICGGSSRKAIHVVSDNRVAICQVDGGKWLTLEGHARVATSPAEVADAEARYTARYQAPRDNPTRVALVIDVDRIMGRT
jgi:F420H(2)-dependent biliverdin reductase